MNIIELFNSHPILSFTVGWGIYFWQQRSSEIINSHYVGFHFASCCWKINLPLIKPFRDLKHCASIPFLCRLQYGSSPFHVHFCKLKRDIHASMLFDRLFCLWAPWAVFFSIHNTEGSFPLSWLHNFFWWWVSQIPVPIFLIPSSQNTL